MIENSLIAAASFRPHSLQFPDAWVGHLPFASWVMQEIAPKIFVELGTHSGNSYFSFCQSVLEGGLSSKCYAVDTWKGDEHAGAYNDEIFNAVNKQNQERYSGFSRLLKMTFDDAVNYFSDNSINMLHIDGLHTYEAVRHDFETWLPKLAPDAIVMFHDINVRERDFGVWKLWEELQDKYPNHLAFMHSNGLGVLQLNTTLVTNLKWLQPSYGEQQYLKQYFAALGARQLDRYNLEDVKRHVINLQRSLDERSEELTKINSLLVQKEEAITNYQIDAVVRNEKIVKINNDVASRDEQIVKINNDLVLRDEQLFKVNNDLTETSSKLSPLYQINIDQNDAVIKLNLRHEERESFIVHLNNIVKDQGLQITRLHQTSSWRMTAPLRIVAHQFKRALRATELITPAIKRGGGIKNTANKAVQLYRNEGIAGIRRGFKIVATNVQIIPSSGSDQHDRNDYTEWVRRYDNVTEKTRVAMRLKISLFSKTPLISIVMPTYNPKTDWLVKVIESVRQQIYTNWELCIADDASTDPSIRPILERYVNEDSRIKVVFREKNGHISASSNSALQLAGGEWVALLDHDDLLSEHALFWVIDTINKNPDAQLLYSDEDKIDEVGKRFDPYFKSDWNPDLFYSQNMISHLGVYRASLLSEIGGFRLGMEGSQDYDLALRSIERIAASQIHHIPYVLYHWRMHAESTAQSADAKPYAMIAGEKALNEHFQRINIKANAELIGYGYRVHYLLPSLPPLVTLIIPTRNGLQLIRNCIDSILNKTIYPNYEILIIDNASDDPETIQYFEVLKKNSKIRIVHDDRPFNYSAMNNSAVKVSKGDFIGLLNNDIEVISPEWLNEMVSIALQPGVGAVGASLWYPDDTLQHGGVITGIGGVANHAHKNLSKGAFGYFARAKLIQNFSAVTAACLVVKKSVFLEVGELDEINLKVAFNDVDFCLRLREAGYRNIWTPYAELYHHESATRGYEDTPEKQARFTNEVLYMEKRWGSTLMSDPAYNRNLTLDHEDFSLAWPPRVGEI
jgi:glycosyltransferase involved in cell wall biosynthesis